MLSDPFIPAPVTWTKGLDPLRLQSPAIAAYQRLLPGLNNVTAYVRAYSFYCWVLREYARVIETDAVREQQRFVRSAEWLVALCAAVHPDIESSAGINTALRVVRDLEEGEERLPIREKVFTEDDGTDGTFFKNPHGVLGQYYRNTLVEIGLIKSVPGKSPGGQTGKLYQVTTSEAPADISGEDLAEAFANGITPEQKGLFLRLISEEATNVSEIRAGLGTAFDLARIDYEPERDLLIRLLAGPDDPRTEANGEAAENFRLQSLSHLLNYYRRDPEAKGNFTRFTAWVMENKGVDEVGNPDACLAGWYYYQLSEEFQFACTALLGWLLEELRLREGPRWVVLNDFIGDCAAALRRTAGDESLTVGQLRARATPDEEADQATYYLQRLFAICREHGDAQAAGAFITNLSFTTDAGYRDVLAFIREVDQKTYELLEGFLSGFLRNHILLRHERVAFSKLRQQGIDTARIVREGDLVRYVDGYKATATGPRLQVATGFLRQLRLLEEKDEKVVVTTAGENWLNSLP